MNCNYKVKITDIQTKYKFKVFCTGYDDSEIKEKVDAIYQAFPKTTAEGETPTLDNTANATMSIDLKGNTSQETTTGKNIWNLGSLSGTTQAGITLTKDTDGGFLLNGTSTGVGRFKIALNTDINETITLYLKSPNNSGDIMISLRDANDAQLISMRNDNVLKVYSYTPTAPVRYIELIQLTSGVQYTNYKIYPMMVKGSYTNSTIGDYEPYTNGASPNPDYPQDVHVVTGDNSINVCGKNLFNEDNVSIGYLKEDGTLSADTAYRTSDYISIRPNTTYYKTSTGSPRTKYFDINKIPLNTTTYWDIPTGGSAGTFTTPNNAYYLRFSYPGVGSSSIDADTIMIKEGTDTTYEAYTGASYPVNLGTMELCKIETYQDYIYKENKKWYLHKEIGKKVYEGSEYFGYGASGETGISVVNTGGIGMKQGNYLGGKSNYFMNNQSGKLVNTIRFGANDTNLWIYISSSEFSSADDFKTWVSTHNIEVYYILATPTTTEITDATLISQLNALAEAESYSGQTNISQTNDDKPFILTAKALKDLSNL